MCHKWMNNPQSRCNGRISSLTTSCARFSSVTSISPPMMNVSRFEIPHQISSKSINHCIISNSKKICPTAGKIPKSSLVGQEKKSRNDSSYKHYSSILGNPARALARFNKIKNITLTAQGLFVVMMMFVTLIFAARVICCRR